ncbi:DNA repair protein RecN [Treponema pectinovorum]|uniref:DNA repair protein RecN n=1 Tax=Treponema pectinovorum TaxID=164 RepID=UPI0011F195F0|nr:DNA repair protein RecN [Treponema pectinovorum]
MLEDLRIKNFALIDSAAIDFKKGFTVLSGETGAGKSLLIGALTFLLGGKGGVEQIRVGCSLTEVSGTFYLKGLSSPVDSSAIDEEDIKTPAQWLYVHGIECEDDRVLIRRTLRDNGKSAAWIGETPVTRSDLASFCNFLVDIHGQHEHQSLMRVGEHRKFLDSFAGLEEKVEKFKSLYSLLVEKRNTLLQLLTDDKNREQKIELLSFAVKEISEAKLKKDEDKDLDEEEKKLSSFEKLYSNVEEISGIFEGSDSGNGVVAMLKKIRSYCQACSSFDRELSQLDSRLESVFYELSDIADEYSKYKSSLTFDPERLAFVQERQTLIYNLKKKYASSQDSSISEVLKFAEDAQKKLDELSVGEKNKDSLKNEIAELEKHVYSMSKEISQERKIYAKSMSQKVMENLKTLGMNGTLFSVEVKEKNGSDLEQRCGPYGIDEIEFLIAANPGNPLQSLAKIASGGELSRVMLSIKTVLAQNDTVDTLVFDEIDTGIGGEVAVSVGHHLKKLAEKRQILCITHLASIAVYADNQFKISKKVSSSVTQTDVKEIEGEQRVEEIARMLSGDTVSQESLEHARSMLLKFSKSGGS